MNQGKCSAPISVLIATYEREQPENLVACLDSIYAQTCLPRQIVLVLDGPVGSQLRATVDRTRLRPGCQLDVLELPKRGGLARALNAGLALCTEKFVARMDSDDIAHPDRFAVQHETLASRNDCWVSITWAAEFVGPPTNVIRRKTPPENHDAIVRGLKWRVVICHPTLMAPRRLFLQVGGYRPDFGLLEDYDLYVRMILAGAKFHCVQRSLLLFRVTSEQVRSRRSGWKMARDEWRIRSFFCRSGFLSFPRFLVAAAIMSGYRISPSSAKEALYRFVRKPGSKERAYEGS
jgi:glycosyltransferase involved in cell wall biosynthesis